MGCPSCFGRWAWAQEACCQTAPGLPSWGVHRTLQRKCGHNSCEVGRRLTQCRQELEERDAAAASCKVQMSRACRLRVQAEPRPGIGSAFGPEPWTGPGRDPASDLEMGVHFVKAHPSDSVLMSHPSGKPLKEGGVSILSLISLVREPRPREGGRLARGHTASL